MGKAQYETSLKQAADLIGALAEISDEVGDDTVREYESAVVSIDANTENNLGKTNRFMPEGSVYFLGGQSLGRVKKDIIRKYGNTWGVLKTLNYLRKLSGSITTDNNESVISTDNFKDSIKKICEETINLLNNIEKAKPGQLSDELISNAYDFVYHSIKLELATTLEHTILSAACENEMHKNQILERIKNDLNDIDDQELKLEIADCERKDITGSGFLNLDLLVKLSLYRFSKLKPIKKEAFLELVEEIEKNHPHAKDLEHQIDYKNEVANELIKEKEEHSKRRDIIAVGAALQALLFLPSLDLVNNAGEKFYPDEEIVEANEVAVSDKSYTEMRVLEPWKVSDGSNGQYERKTSFYHLSDAGREKLGELRNEGKDPGAYFLEDNNSDYFLSVGYSIDYSDDITTISYNPNQVIEFFDVYSPDEIVEESKETIDSHEKERGSIEFGLNFLFYTLEAVIGMALVDQFIRRSKDIKSCSKEYDVAMNTLGIYYNMLREINVLSDKAAHTYYGLPKDMREDESIKKGFQKSKR